MANATLAPINLRDFPPVEQNITRPETLSQTLMGKHDNCPRSAYLSRKYRGGTGSIEMDRGIALHDSLERCQNLMIETGESTIPGEVARDIAESVMAERTELVLPTREQDRVRAMAWNWAESSFGTIDPNTILGVEIPMHIDLGGFKCTCRVDRAAVASRTLYVDDWKSGFPGSREEVQQSFQGKFYGMVLLFGVVSETGLNLGAGINDVWFYEVFPRRRKDDGTLVALEAVWSREELFEFKGSLERNIEAFASSLETGLWPARDGSWCSYCPARSECPIPAHLRQVEEINTVADAEDAFSHLLALDEEKRRYQTGLRGWVKENSAVFLGDYAFDAISVESHEVVDWAKLEYALYQSQELGVPFRKEDHVRLKQGTKFSKRKLTEEERHGSQG